MLQVQCIAVSLRTPQKGEQMRVCSQHDLQNPSDLCVCVQRSSCFILQLTSERVRPRELEDLHRKIAKRPLGIHLALCLVRYGSINMN